MATGVLRQGSRGAPVERWQEALNDQLPGGLALLVDGVFGPRTDAATRAFQQARGLTVDGVVGPRTRAAMGAGRFGLSAALRALDGLRRVSSPYPAAIIVDDQGALAQADITTRRRLAAFLAQLSHESASFRALREDWGPTAQQRRYEPPSPLASRLGNTEPGDGFRFRGGGPMQLTGRANYRLLGRRLGLPLEERPELIEQPAIGMATAAAYWAERKLNTYADRVATGRERPGQSPFELLTRRINGWLNGYPDRVVRWNKAQRALGLIA